MAILTDKRHITRAGLANTRVVLALSPRKRKGTPDNGMPFDECCTRSKNDRVDDTERVPETAHTMSSRPAMAKLIFEFVGGPHDGRIVFGIVGEASDAERFFLFSNWGAVGQRFKVASEYAVETLAKEKPAFRAALDVWISLWRDLMLIAGSHPNRITNQDRLDQIETLNQSISIRDAKNVIASLEKTRTRIDRNVNARLTAENLMLELPFL
jgi:hypothetical protein